MKLDLTDDTDTTQSPTFPYSPEPPDALRRRYPIAIAKVLYMEDLPEGQSIRAAKANVFDFPDGLRLIVGRENLGGRLIVDHMSASVAPDSDLHRAIESRISSGHAEIAHRAFDALSLQRLAYLSGQPPQVHSVCMSPNGSPQWFRIVEEL
jgi:hypothetical protein